MLSIKGKLQTKHSPLLILFNFQVTRTRDAKTAALNQLRQLWGVNLGGGREWFHVTPNQWNNFLGVFQGAIQQYRPQHGGQLRRTYTSYNLRRRRRY